MASFGVELSTRTAYVIAAAVEDDAVSLLHLEEQY